MIDADNLLSSSPNFAWPGVLHEIRIKAVRTANDDGKEAANAAEASAGAVGSISICRVAPDLFVTPVSDSQQRLKVIAWHINQLQRVD